MFKLNYVLQDGGPKYEESYPSTDKNSNFFIIRGSNDQGKTTSLNMVALGLYGSRLFDDNDKSKIIPDNLKAKMDYFQSGDLDEIAFNFELLSKDEKTKIASEYLNNDLRVKLNDNNIGSDEFMKSIQLLYDIPDDPIIKLNSSIKLIRENLIDYSKYLERYKDRIKTISERINDFNNREDRKKKLLSKLDKYKNNLDVNKELLTTVNQEVEKYDIYAAVHKSNDLKNDIENIDLEIANWKNIKKELHEKGIGKRTKKFREQISDYDNQRMDAIKHINEIDKFKNLLSEEDQKQLEVIKTGLQKGREISKINVKNVELWFENIISILKNIESDDSFEELKDEREQFDLIDNLLQVLRDHLGNNFKIPGTDKENVFSFYQELDRYNKELKPKISKIENLKRIKDELSKLSVSISDFKIKLTNIPKTDSTDHDKYESAEKDIKKLEEKKNKLELDLIEYLPKFEQISDDEFESILQESCVIEELENRSREKKYLEDEISKLNIEIPKIEGQIEELANITKPPDYDEEWLKNKYSICENLQKKIESWKKILGSIDLKKGDLGIELESSKDFLNALSEYFADILKEVHYEQKSWKVYKVDLIERQYVVEGRKPIRFVQVGTGHTALNSILSRIKQKFPEKKKILLIDEIGHMDEKNIGKLKEEIIKQIQSGETILALMTIADNNVEKTTWEAIY